MSDVKKEIEEKEDELIELLKEKVDRLKAKRKTIRVRGRLVPNDDTIDPQTGRKMKELEDD
ncbi:MAG: hypothetical protein IMZ52_08660 [Actinobacteria bacterium]|nr:hypothetical protein [Actinomycetota bacterium]MBE3121487.1 hypothetical protein [Thermoplasmata archaeon]